MVLFFSVTLFLGVTMLLTTENAWCERIFFAGYNGGFYIKSEEAGGMALRFGGAFQTDYRYYAENERSDNGFDIRRARIIFRGRLTRWFRFGMQYEFEGNEPRNLVDAYGDFVFRGSHGLKFGQFKEPFSLEWQTRDKGLFFAERSMGYALTPGRDLGLMLHGTFFDDAVIYGIGIFNGDGIDGTSREGEHDEPEITGRLVFRPFKNIGMAWAGAFQLGCSGSYAKIDLSNVALNVKTTGMAGSGRNIYILSHDTKFGVLQNAGDRMRGGIEVAWINGPLFIQGEYIKLKYGELKPAGAAARDAVFSSYYVSATYCLTGETPVFVKGRVSPIYPNRFFNPSEGTFGAFCLSARLEHFSGDENWITPDAHVSVRKADAVSVALNWVLFPMCRIIADYTYTDLSDRIRVNVDPEDGEVDYIDRENVVTLRFSFDF